MTEGPCSYTGCACSEPDRLVSRSLKGTGYIETYCRTHDPLTDASVSDMWQRVIGA